MTRPRLLMISTHGYVAARPQLGRPDTGGQVVYVLELSRALAACGYEVDILTRRFDRQPTTEYVDDGVRIIRVPYAGGGFQPKEVLAGYVPELLNGFFQRPRSSWEDYQLVSSHYWDAGVAGVGIARRLKIPHLHTPHSLGLLKRQNQAWGQSGESTTDHLDERIQSERAIYHQSDLVIPTAAEQTRCLLESDEYNVPEERVLQVPPGFDDSLFFPLPPEDRRALKRQLGWQGPAVFCAGRMAVSKGYDLMIASFPAILKRVPEARLYLAIGSETPSDNEKVLMVELQDLAHQLGVADRVHFLSCVNQQRLADYYHAADVFVLCSRNEPFGMTAIEAMACGTPTVVTTHGGLWEELTWGQDCIYCDPLDADALCQAVCSPLLHGRIQQQLSVNGRETVAARYTWTEIARRIVQCGMERGWLQPFANDEVVVHD